MVSSAAVVDRLRKDEETGCWEWPGSCDTSGYGQVGVGGTTRKTHRLVYEHLVGEIPQGLQIDHLCRNRKCANPAHLEPVTQQENIRRGQGIQVLNAAKTHCPQAHEYTADNTYRYPNGRRECRICRADNVRRFYQRRAEQEMSR